MLTDVVFAAIFSGQFTDAMAFSTLLTVESLLFAGISVTLALSSPQSAIKRAPVAPPTLGAALASLVTLVALCGVLMWSSVFVAPWPHDVRGIVVAVVVLATIVGEAVVAWIVALALSPRSNVPPAAG